MTNATVFILGQYPNVPNGSAHWNLSLVARTCLTQSLLGKPVRSRFPIDLAQTLAHCMANSLGIESQRPKVASRHWHQASTPATPLLSIAGTPNPATWPQRGSKKRKRESAAVSNINRDSLSLPLWLCLLVLRFLRVFAATLSFSMLTGGASWAFWHYR